MTEQEFQDVALLYDLDTERPSIKVAKRVLVFNEKVTAASKDENVAYQTAVHSIKNVSLKYQIYLNMKNKIITEYTKAI